jgi:hypothetical protein
MKKILNIFIFFIFLTSCQTIGNKVDKATKKEEERLEKFLSKTESELKIEFGKPDLVEIADNQSRILTYFDTKFKIKCERRFEIDKTNKVIGFSSKNCF